MNTAPQTRILQRPQIRAIQTRGTYPGEDWQIDFTIIARVLGIFRDLLALENTVSGWKEAFPARTEMTAEVAKALLKDIVPRLGLPGSLQRNNGSAFVSQAMMEVSALGIKWTFVLSLETSPPKLSARDPNQTLKWALSQGMSGNPRKLALVCMWLAPGDKLKLSVFELLTHT